jgi:hypothetical protein
MLLQMTVRSAADGLMRYWRGIDTSRGVGGTREEESCSMQASSCMQFVLDNFEAVARSEVPCLLLHIYLFIYLFRGCGL